MPSPESLNPVLLEPVLVERVWGTHDLGGWHAPPSGEQPVGELWLTAEECHVANTGAALKDLLAAHPEAFGAKDGAGFPLLIKLLFPREKLSVQVHPNDAEAQAGGHRRGKTECWYVLSAEENAEVAVGLRRPLTADQLRSAIADGSVESELRKLRVKAGDMVFVEAGTVHAIGPGAVILETQQYCDVTYRLWDYGRPRELHLDSGLAVVRAETGSGLVKAEAMDGFDRLLTSPYFVVDRFRLVSGASVSLGETRSLQVVIATGPGVELQGSSSTIPLPVGQAAVLPMDTKDSQDPHASWSLQASAPTDVLRVLQPAR